MSGNSYTGYQGFQPYAYRRTETEKIQGTGDQRDHKFRQAGATVLEDAGGFSATTARSQRNTRRQHYVDAHARPQNPLKQKDHRGFVGKKFYHTSTYSTAFPNYLQELLALEGHSEQEYREAFDRADRDGSGFITAREVKELVSECTGRQPHPSVVQAFMVFFDKNGDSRVSWDEFVEALGRVRVYMQRQVAPPARGGPAGARAQPRHKRLLQSIPRSGAQIDMGVAGEDPIERTRPTGSDLFEGSTKVTSHIAGYRGHISKTNPESSSGRRARPNKNDQFIVETYNMNPPGYSGIKNANPKGMGNLQTDKSRIDRLVDEMWSERNSGRGTVLSQTTRMLKPFVPKFEDQ
jgi:hypothetical protein